MSTEKNQDQASGVRRSNPVYELFVLGELMSGPTYGYKLNEIINRVLGPQQQLSWGTLYPLIRRLEHKGLATTTIAEKSPQDALPVERGQPRRIYAITEAGRARFFELMCQPQSYTYHPDFFTVQLIKFEFLIPQQRLDILRHYRATLASLRAFYEKGRLMVEGKPQIRAPERPFIFQMVSYRLHMLDAELAWFDQAIADSEIANHQTTREE